MWPRGGWAEGRSPSSWGRRLLHAFELGIIHQRHNQNSHHHHNHNQNNHQTAHTHTLSPRHTVQDTHTPPSNIPPSTTASGTISASHLPISAPHLRSPSPPSPPCPTNNQIPHFRIPISHPPFPISPSSCSCSCVNTDAPCNRTHLGGEIGG